MFAKTNLSVYCIANVSSPPVALSRRDDTSAYYCHLAVPIKENLVIFCEGDWDEDDAEFLVTLKYKEDQMELGKITKAMRCLYWNITGKEIPRSMQSETENGLAKLLLERCEMPIHTESLNVPGSNLLKEVNENTPQIIEEAESTPDRPQKKRRTSLNKDDKTPNGPSSKKQKVQKVPTRTRTPKTENNEKDSTGGKKNDKLHSPTSENKPPNDQKEAKKTPSDSKTPKTNETSKGKRKSLENPILRAFLANNLEKKENASDTSTTNVSSSEQQTKNADKTPKATKASKDNKETPKSSKLADSNEENCNKDKSEKKGRRKSEAKKEEKVLEVLDEKNTGVKRTRKSRAETQEESEKKTKTDSVDKENVQTDTNIPKTQSDVKFTQKSSKKEVKISTTGKIATCKDLTLRALERPTGRWGHSLCFVSKSMAVVIGGQGEKQQISKDSVWTLDCETRRWKDPPTEAEGQKPEYRMGHTATYDPLVRCIYVFGGSKNTRWFHDVHMLDLEEWKWQLVKVNGKAPTRAYHSATLYRHELWIFGGVYPRPDPQPDGCSNEVHIFSTVMESWYTPIVSGEKPIPRSGHSATLLNDRLVIFGGWDAPISYSDLHVLDMSIVEWSQPEVKGTPPSPRSWHASCALSGNRLLIHGGYNGDFALEDTHIFDLDKSTWSQIFVENSPSARVGHKALCMPYRHDNEEEDEVIIFGGGDNDGAYFDDLYSIYVPFNPATVL